MKWIITILCLFKVNNYLCHKPIDFHVELLIATDYSVYKMHEKIVTSKKWNKNDLNETELVSKHIKTYYTEIISQVNDRYEASFKEDPDIRIKVSISQFYIAEKPDDSSWSEPLSETNIEDKVNGDLSLIEFNAWLENNRNSFSSFDHAFGVTAMDLVSDDSSLDYNGLGYIYGICKKLFSGSLIEDRGAFESVRSFAHELAHNLGTDHDGLTSSKDCPEWDNFIMAPKFFPYNQLNSWKFSNCSKNKIKEFLLDSNNNECLINKPDNDKNERLNYELYPGQIYNLFDQCRHLHGPHSIPCFEYESIFCQSLFCRSNTSDPNCIWMAPATEGSDCGDKNWCIKGLCEPKTDLVQAKTLSKKSHESTDTCKDEMDNEFCETVLTNNYCDETFYWNGKSIAKEWCKKKCKKC